MELGSGVGGGWQYYRWKCGSRAVTREKIRVERSKKALQVVVVVRVEVSSTASGRDSVWRLAYPHSLL